jgi:ATP-dependent helicase/DNAse subunit B
MKKRIRTSYSSLNVFASCARKFEFDKLYPKPPRVFEDNYAADVGTAIHAGYQHYLAHGDRDESVWAFMRAFPFADEWNQENDYRSSAASLATLEEMFDSVKMLEYQLARIRRPNTVAETEAGLTGGVVVPAVEVPFEIKFPGLEIRPCPALPEGGEISVIGYIDAIMQNQMTGLYRTLDIKTSRMKLLDATGKFKFDAQQVPYGIVVDHIAQGNVESFEVLYLDCYIDLLEPSVQLYPFIKNRHDLQDWATNKLIQFRQLAGYAESDYFPRTDGGCLFYNRPCRYLEPCQSRDRESLKNWFMLDSTEQAKEDEFFPWVTAEIDLGVEA